MNRQVAKQMNVELRKVQVRLERELREAGIDEQLEEGKAEVKRLRNRNRMRCVRDGTWSAVKALSRMPFGEFQSRLREMLRDPRPGPPFPSDASIFSRDLRGESAQPTLRAPRGAGPGKAVEVSRGPSQGSKDGTRRSVGVLEKRGKQIGRRRRGRRSSAARR